ncbi:Uncharacterized protein Rs2_37109 [Raphanus sativus]|nr:Uncharacterized protein Rs2_37109 [Raphanus sativus]
MASHHRRTEAYLLRAKPPKARIKFRCPKAKQLKAKYEEKAQECDVLVTPKKKQKDKKQKKVETTLEIRSDDAEGQARSLKKLKKVVTTTEPSEIDSDDPEALVKPKKLQKDKKPKKLKK